MSIKLHGNQTYRALACVFMLMASIACATADDSEQRRQTDTKQPASELPSPHALTAARATVLHAGGAVQLTIPSTWQVQEVPHGRQLRLLLTPALPQDGSPPRLLMWLTLRYRPVGIPDVTDEQLLELASRRAMKHLRSSARITRSDLWQNHGSTWAQISFEGSRKARETELPGEPESQNATQSNGHPMGDHAAAVSGSFWMQMVSWGRLEVCGINLGSSRDPADDGSEAFESVMRSIRLRRPKTPTFSPSSDVRDAVDALGLWKSSRSMMRLEENGRITIITDKPFEVEVMEPESGLESQADDADHDASRRVKWETTLTGRYRAQGDLIMTTWADGSELNYRWKLHRGDLLLTDHLGRTAKLWKLAH